MIAQHTSRLTARKLAGDPIISTLIGATADVVMWWLMKRWPWWIGFVLPMALFSFFFATRILSPGPSPLAANYCRWSNGLSTLIFIVFHDALTQVLTGDDPTMKFYQRIVDYLLVTLYSVYAVLVYDAVVERLSCWRSRSSVPFHKSISSVSRNEKTNPS